MTSFVERTFGRQPKVGDGVPGEALVLQSVASLPPMTPSGITVGGWSGWAYGIPLLVRLPGSEPYAVHPVRWMTRARYPIAGTTLPVTVERNDPSILRIEWDEVPKIDEWIAAGHPVFTDPDSVEAQLRNAVEANQARIAQSVDRGNAAYAEDVMGPAPPLDRDAIQTIFEGLRAQHAEANPRPELHRPEIDGPSGRILAVGRQEGTANQNRGEILLSVAVPGKPRYGVRWKGWVPAAKMKFEWWDVPLEVDRSKPQKVKILWDQVPGIEVVTPLLGEMNDRMAARLADPPTATVDAYEPILAAISDPAKRAEVERQLAEGLARAGGATAAAPDALERLAQLGKLRDDGALTEAEFAAEKARLLSEM